MFGVVTRVPRTAPRRSLYSCNHKRYQYCVRDKHRSGRPHRSQRFEPHVDAGANYLLQVRRAALHHRFGDDRDHISVTGCHGILRNYFCGWWAIENDVIKIIISPSFLQPPAYQSSFVPFGLDWISMM